MTKTECVKPRLLVLTDISSLTTGVREPDDGQSMVRLMLYANELEIEGLIATSNMRHGRRTQPELIGQIVEAYREVRPHLARHSGGYPKPDALMSRIKRGQPHAGPDVSVEECVGEGMETEGSEWILHILDRPDPRPLWITIWGGATDLAQALWTLAHTRSSDTVKRALQRLRVHAIGDQDSAAPWIKATFPELFYITNCKGFRGMYRVGETDLVSHDWVETHVRRDHGPLGALYPNYHGGDNRTNVLGRVNGVKEGDTPSFLSLVPNGLGDASDVDGWRPEWGSWGGRFERDRAANGESSESSHPNHYTDACDRVPGVDADPDPYMAATYRWRPAFQADFQARLDWCVSAFEEANHPPIPVVMGDGSRRAIHLKAAPGETVPLSAEGSSDPDGDPLHYRWWEYEEAGAGAQNSVLSGEESEEATLHVAKDARPGAAIHVILELIDRGDPPLTRYRRILVTVDR